MSTTIKRIALVAVAALGFGVLSVVPSQAAVQDLTVTVTANGTPTLTSQDTTTAAAFTVAGLLDASSDTVSVTVIQKTIPALATAPTVLLGFVETTTVATKADNQPVWAAQLNKFESTTSGITLSGGVAYVGAKFTLQFESLTATLAGTYTYTVIAKPYTGGAPGTAKTADVTLTIAAAAVVAAAVPAAANAKAVIEAGNPTEVSSLTDSVTAGSFTTAATPIGKILVTNASATGVAAKDTITVTMTGVGYMKTGSTTGRYFVIDPIESATISIFADGTSGTGTITIKTAAGGSFVKTATFFDTKPVTAVTTVAKAYIQAGTGSVKDVFATTVKDTLGNVITDGGVTVTAAPTDTATTVGGAAVCAWNVKGAAYHCEVAGLSAIKFGPVAYTITVTGTGINLATTLKTTATVTFADNVATKAVLAGPASGTPGATVEYTLTLTEKNGYPVADQTYGVSGAGGALFSATAADTVLSGFTGTGATLPFSASESFTSKSGVITSKGTLPIAGVATGSWTLIGDGIATSGAIDKTIGKTKVTVSTDVTNPGVDAATDAANEATDAANAATDAALAAAEAADAATTAAQEASDAVAALSASVTKLIEGLQAQIKSLAAVVAKIAKKVKA